MTGKLTHRVSRIISQLLIGAGHGTLPSDDGSWPVFYYREPDKTDNQITVLDRAGFTNSRQGLGSERPTHHGAQILIRGLPESAVFSKAQDIIIYLDEGVYRELLTIDSSDYIIYTITRVGDYEDLGAEPEASKRSIISINMLVALRQL
jgi:hypothetical protein